MNELVVLSWGEVHMAAYAGVDRHIRALYKRRSPSHDVARDIGWDPHLWGALGECAVAKATQTYWPCGSSDLDHAGDVGAGIHVRTADRPDKKLLLHKTDPDAGIFLLVVPAGLPRLRIAGWIYGRDGKQDCYWETFTGRPAYFVPQSALRPIDELRTVEP